MFGLPSFTKLLVLAGIILAVWYGFKLIARLDAQRKIQEKQRARAAAHSASMPEAEEMMACPACRAYVPVRQKTNCGRVDCPY